MLSRFVEPLIARQRWLDPVGAVLQRAVGAVYAALGPVGRPVKTFLHGTWLGHALHTAIVDIPVGAWTVGLVADVAALARSLRPEIGDFAVFIGVLGSYAALITGLTDFHETAGEERKTATAHGLLMTMTIMLYTASWLLRWRVGPALHGVAVGLAIAGYVLALSGAYVGGHLVFKIGTMVNRNAFVAGPADRYVRVGRSSDFPDGRMMKVDAEGMGVLVLRHAGRLYAMSNTCAHAGGPLNEGTLEGTVVTCPWHASQFDLAAGGRVVNGPSTFDQVALSVRETPDGVDVKIAGR